MRGTVLYGPRDIRFEDRETPKIVEPIARWTSAVQSRRCCARKIRDNHGLEEIRLSR